MSSKEEKTQVGMTIECIDSHTGGEPTRVVISGLPALRGRTAREQQRDLAFADRRTNRAAQLAEKKKWKAINKTNRRRDKERGRRRYR